MKRAPFRPADMTFLHGRISGTRSFRHGASPTEAWVEAVLSAKAKRQRLLEEARSAVLDRIRRAG